MKLKNIEKLIADNKDKIREELKEYVKTIIVDDSDFDTYFDDNHRSHFLSTQGQEQLRLAKITQATNDMAELEDYIPTVSKIWEQTKEDDVALILMKNMCLEYLSEMK